MNFNFGAFDHGDPRNLGLLFPFPTIFPENRKFIGSSKFPSSVGKSVRSNLQIVHEKSYFKLVGKKRVLLIRC